MKADWESRPIGEVFRVVNGGTPKTGVSEYWDGTHQWITPAEMGNLSSPYLATSRRTLTDEGLRVGAELVPPQTIILSSRAPIGHLAINEVPMAFNQGCKGLVPSLGISTKFAYYFLLAHVPLLESLGTGATFKELSSSKLKEVLFRYPPLPEQQRIVALLDEAFNGIATAKANTEKNLQNARSIFESHLQSVFNDATKLGQTVVLADLATDITDGDHMPPPKTLEGVPFITIGNIAKDTHTVDFSDTFMVPRDYFDSLKANKRPQLGDVLYTVTGSYGVPVLIKEHREFCFQRHIGLVRPKPDVSSEWLYYLLMSPQVIKQANDGATGTAQKTVSLKVLRGYKVPKIPLAMQLTMVAKLSSFFEETQRLETTYQQKLTALEELKKSLLHRAFNGDL